MAVDTEPTAASTVELSRMIREREVSPTEVVEAFLDRIERLDPTINAFVEVFGEEARAAAAESDRRVASGDPKQIRPLEGIPIPIKDLVMVSGHRLGFGTRLSPPFPMFEDSEVVARLRAAGAVLLGRTTLPELGSVPTTESVATGVTRNPWDLERSSGGSSGGAAAAVAAGMAPAAHGTDGGGSLRVPASVCGLFTLKPTRGLISRAPLEDEMSLTVDGFLTRTVADNARLLDAVAGSIPGDAYFSPAPRPALAEQIASPPGRLKIAVTLAAPVGIMVQPACAVAVRQAASLLADLGHDVVEVTPPWREDSLADTFLKVWAAVVGSGIDQLAAFGGGTVEDAEPHNRALYAMAKELDSVGFGVAIAAVRGYVRRVMPFFREHDALLTPTIPEPPWKLGELFSRVEANPLWPIVRATPIVAFTAFCNMSGQPAMSLPLGEHRGLPVGVQIAGRMGDDGLLLRLAAQIEEARPWAGRRASLGWAGA